MGDVATSGIDSDSDEESERLDPNLWDHVLNKKVSYYVLVFLFIWIFGFVNRVTQAAGATVGAVVALQAAIQPLQGICNCVVYSFAVSAFRSRVRTRLGFEVQKKKQAAAPAPPMSMATRFMIVIAFAALALSRGALSFAAQEAEDYYSPVSIFHWWCWYCSFVCFIDAHDSCSLSRTAY